MELNSSNSYIDEFDSNEVPGRQSIFPTKGRLLLYLFLSLIFLIFFEKLCIKIFLYFIPSYFFLILTWLIIHYFFLIYLTYSCIFPGKNFLVEFYLHKFYGRSRARQFYNSLEHLKNRIDKIIKNDKNKDIKPDSDEEIIIQNNDFNNNGDTSKSKVSSKYMDIYIKIKECYGSLNKYETEFLNKLILLKTAIENTSLQENFKKSVNKEIITLSNKDLKDYENVKSEASSLQELLNEYKSDFPFVFDMKKIISYFQNLFFNDILGSKRFSRISVLLKNQNSREITIASKDNTKLDCLLMLSQAKDIKNKNLVIVCGPNLTPFESFINSWDIDDLYLSNSTDILFWNYRGYGFSEGSVNFNNICDDILCVYDYVEQNYNYKNIAVHGLSIGGISACYLAKNRKIKLLIADRTFGSVMDFINSFKYGNKVLFYLAKILRIPFIDNARNFMDAKCVKILLNDPQDTTVIDPISLKTSISRRLIYELFNEKYLEFNIRNIKSYNVLDYALEPEQAKEIFNAFKYTINFCENKYYENLNNREDNFKDLININNDKDLLIKVNEDDKQEKLNENKMIDNIYVNQFPKQVLDDISKNIYIKIYNTYSNFNSAGDYLIKFIDNMNNQLHFNNFFNNLFIYGSEDLKRDDIVLCDIKIVDEMMTNIILEAEKFLNSKEISRFSEYSIIKNFQFLIECFKKIKIYFLSLHMDNIEKEWIKELKGELVPLNCGHILFYNDRELETIKTYIKENLNEKDEINNNFNNNNINDNYNLDINDNQNVNIDYNNSDKE